MGTDARIPETIEAEFIDRTVWLGARAGLYGLELGGVVSFATRLDEARLRRALRLLLDAEPVLGCRFDAEAVPPVFRRLRELDASPLLDVIEAHDPATDAATFIATPFRDGEPQIGALLLHGSGSDSLAVRVGHLAADGGAVKEALYLLGEIYRMLGEDPAWTPEPNVDGVRAPVVKAGPLERLRSLGPGDLKTPRFGPDWTVPLTGDRGPASYVWARVEPPVFGSALARARQEGATANDVILTALYRTLWRLLHVSAGDATPQMVTCELRKHLAPGTKTALANISSVWWISVSPAGNETFEATLARVAAATRVWKRGGAGKGSAIGIPLIHRFVRRKGLEAMGKMMPMAPPDPTKGAAVLTNIGVIDEARLAFGADAPVVDACLLAPVSPMGVGLAASTYRDRLHLTAGVEFAAIGEEMANAIVTGTAREIDCWASPSPMEEIDLQRGSARCASGAGGRG